MNRENEGLEGEPMNCLEFRELLHELDRPGTHGAAQLDSAMAHAEGCGDCGVLLVEEESLGFALQKIAQETARMPGAARVEAELLKAFRQEVKPASIEAIIPMRSGMRWGVVALGIAAAVLLVLGTVIYQRNVAKTPDAPAVNAEVNPSAKSGDSPAPQSLEASAQDPVSNSAANPVSASSASSKVAPNAKTSAAASDADTTEYATAFVPLPYADDPSTLEGGSVVRVTLARSVLESYGLPAEGLGAGDRVTADMIVSEDGTPQAIRLVSLAD
jgi:hypothetical protein